MTRDISKWRLLKDINEIKILINQVMKYDVANTHIIKNSDMSRLQNALEAHYNKLNGYLLAIEEVVLKKVT